MGKIMKWNSIIEKLYNKILDQEGSEEIRIFGLDIKIDLVTLTDTPYYSLKINDGESYIHLNTFFRAISNNIVIFTSSDEEMFFGFNEPQTFKSRFDNNFSGKNLKELKILYPIRDLILYFEDNFRIEILVSSAGFENWQLDGEKTIVCLGGGGELALF
jgi:hypothetical protein